VLEGTYNVVKSFERRIRRKIKGHVHAGLPEDFSAEFRAIHEACSPYTMTGPLRMHALYEAVRYVEQAKIDGDIVECGVWRGGSAMVAAMAMRELGSESRQFYLYDTFEGMPAPSDQDVRSDGRTARSMWKRQAADSDRGSAWCYAPVEQVRQNLATTGYPQAQIHFVQGRVEQTIPQVAPQRIAILRLDTDWYESTWHELVHLYPRLSTGGVLILDDYGAWRGAREATDKYFSQAGHRPLLCRIDEAARIAVKPG
jgi:hypothetical protein